MKIDDGKLNGEIERLYSKIQDGTMEQNSTELFTYMWLAELRDRRNADKPLKMKLNDLRPTLRAEKVNLYIEVGVPIKYEIWGLDDETDSLAEYRLLDDIDERENDTMFLDYGHYNVDGIGKDNDGAVYIGISI